MCCLIGAKIPTWPPENGRKLIIQEHGPALNLSESILYFFYERNKRRQERYADKFTQKYVKIFKNFEKYSKMRDKLKRKKMVWCIAKIAFYEIFIF